MKNKIGFLLMSLVAFNTTASLFAEEKEETATEQEVVVVTDETNQEIAQAEPASTGDLK